MKPSKLMLKLAHTIKPESAARMRKRISSSIRAYNNQSVFFTWLYQAQSKL
jgi:hypothetical protein